MGKIIIFKNIRDLAFNNDIKNLVLFGEENFIDDSTNVYDLIFHSKQIVDPYELKKPCSLVIPVLRTFNEGKAHKAIYNLNRVFPDFNKFAVSGEFLDFYEAIRKKSGTRIDRIGKYNVVDYDSFISHSENPFFEQDLERRIRKIDENYK